VPAGRRLVSIRPRYIIAAASATGGLPHRCCPGCHAWFGRLLDLALTSVRQSSDDQTFHAQVTNREGRAGYYPYLYGKLEGMLEAAGEAPVIPKNDRRWLREVIRGREPLRCSFCGRTHEAVRKLISGPVAHICDECIDLCNEICDEDESLSDWPWRRVRPGQAPQTAAPRQLAAQAGSGVLDPGSTR
jgi:hypothetical protein